jgi:hypothetical protein
MQTPHPASTSPRSKALTRFTFVLAGVLVLVFGFTLWMFFTEGQRPASAHPSVLPGAPFGTYAQNTQLGLSTMAVGWGLAAVGAVLAFRWRRLAAYLLIASSVIQAFLFVLWFNDPTRPPEKPWGPLFVFVLPPVVLAALLLRAKRRGASRPSGAV